MNNMSEKEKPSRKKYFKKYYKKNKEHIDAKTYRNLRKRKRKLGVDGFKEWKSKENKKYRDKKNK